MLSQAQDPVPPGAYSTRTRSGPLRVLPTSPATPVLPNKTGQPIVIGNDHQDLRAHRVTPDVPHFAEASAGSRMGPLEKSAGFLHDLSQLLCAMDHGFQGQTPLTQPAAERVLYRALADVADANSGTAIDSIARYVTDFDELGSIIEEIEIELNGIPGFQFRKSQAAASIITAPRAAHHDVLIWLLQSGFVVTGIEHSLTQEGRREEEGGREEDGSFLVPLHRPRFPPTPLPFIHSFAC